MNISHCRSMVGQFMPLQAAGGEPRTAQLIEDRPAGQCITMDRVPGSSKSSIEKMTQPLAGYPEYEVLSPYMMVLLGDGDSVQYAEKVLRTPRRCLLDQLGLDDVGSGARGRQQRTDQGILLEFYSGAHRPLMLNSQRFIEQEPTKPYFLGQKIITPDFTFYRAEQDQITTDLLSCRVRDDSGVFFNHLPILELKRYNDGVLAQETALRAGEAYLNKTEYFAEMIEYLNSCGDAGDIMVQNSLETSSDKNTPHLQFIPGAVPLPLLHRPLQAIEGSDCQSVDWYLPTLALRVDCQDPRWQLQVQAWQSVCRDLLENDQVSTTPLFRKREGQEVDLYLIFKQDGSQMAVETLQQAPGWLESCGVFMAGTAKARLFSDQGASAYYEPYGAPDSQQLLSRVAGLFEQSGW
jgi:hypothetical protein